MVALHDFFTNQRRWFETGFSIIAVFFIFAMKGSAAQKKTIIVYILFLLFSFVFAITNFYLTRYILYVIPIVVMIGSYGMVAICKKIPSIAVQGALLILLVAAGCMLTIKKMDTKRFEDTSDMAYLHVTNCMQRSINWTEQQPWKDSLIEVEFPMQQAVSDVRMGYLDGYKPFNYSSNYEKNAHYGVFFILDDDDLNIWNKSKYTVIKRFDDLFAHVFVVEFK